MTAEARTAFQRQIDESPGSEYLFPSPKSTGAKPYIKGVGRDAEDGGRSVLRALRITAHVATRLSAGGVADRMVTQMLRQSDAEVFKLYSQAKLGMMREALAKLDRMANERPRNSCTEQPQ